jgi:hypothetical protein
LLNIRAVTLRRVRYAAHIEDFELKTLRKKRPLGRSRSECESNIKIHLTEIGCENEK